MIFNLNKFYSPKLYKKYYLKFIFWELIKILFFNTSLPCSKLRVKILRIFGASVGDKVIIKPNVKIKYPWNLKIGNSTWIGEGVWIDNISNVTIGNNTCISQGVYICSASHDIKSESFDLKLQPVFIGNNCWIAAKCIIGPNTSISDDKFIKIGQVVTKTI